MLKLTGTGDKASGTVELFPLNGESLWGGPGAWDGDGNRNLCTDVNIWRHVRYKVLFSVPTHLFKYLFIVNCKIHC